MSESEPAVPTQRPVSRIRAIVLAILGASALFVFLGPRLLPIPPQRVLVPFLVVVLFAPPLLPLKFRYKLLVLLALVLGGPMLIPVGPLEDTSPARAMASAESRFFDAGGIEIHYQSAGTGEPVLMLMHPGQPSGLGSWYKVAPALAAEATVVTFDRPGAGLTAWPAGGVKAGESPYSSEAQADQTVALMDHLGVERAVLVGNSAGGSIALLAALRHPERVSALVLISPGVYFGTNDGSPSWIRRVLGTPQGLRLGQLMVRAGGDPGKAIWDSFWHDPARQGAEDAESYQQTFRVDRWDRAFLEIFRAARPLGLPERLGEVRVPVLVVTGDDDKWVPLDHNQRLARELPDGRIETVSECGHLPQQEKPEAFVRLLRVFLRQEIGSLDKSPG